MQHKHKPRIIGKTTKTYTKGTVVCRVCGLMLKEPKTNEVRRTIQRKITVETI